MWVQWWEPQQWGWGSEATPWSGGEALPIGPAEPWCRLEPQRHAETSEQTGDGGGHRRELLPPPRCSFSCCCTAPHLGPSMASAAAGIISPPKTPHGSGWNERHVQDGAEGTAGTVSHPGARAGPGVAFLLSYGNISMAKSIPTARARDRDEGSPPSPL